MKQPLALVAVSLALLVTPSVTAQYKMTTYQLVMLRKGPSADTAGTPAGQAIVKDHVSHLYKLGADGRAGAAGPFTDGGDIQGILIVKADTPEKALEIQAQDPGVKAGIFTVEALPFMAPEGWFGKWEAFPSFETVYFGFLKRGPNRGQDAETAKRLQAEHLAYMDGQSKEGKLVVAGPIMVDEERRGIVVYRVSSADEARQRAEADPMVKAGRLAVELHPWQVPRGALPALPK
jgi:uncharacterized protein YciI